MPPVLCRQGRVWLVESFDHIIRHAVELEEKLEYIRQMRLRAGSRIVRVAVTGCLLRASQAKACPTLRKCLRSN